MNHPIYSTFTADGSVRTGATIKSPDRDASRCSFQDARNPDEQICENAVCYLHDAPDGSVPIPSHAGDGQTIRASELEPRQV